MLPSVLSVEPVATVKFLIESLLILMLFGISAVFIIKQKLHPVSKRDSKVNVLWFSSLTVIAIFGILCPVAYATEVRIGCRTFLLGPEWDHCSRSGSFIKKFL